VCKHGTRVQARAAQMRVCRSAADGVQGACGVGSPGQVKSSGSPGEVKSRQVTPARLVGRIKLVGERLSDLDAGHARGHAVGIELVDELARGRAQVDLDAALLKVR
jgi:hypothetical protein